MDRHDQSVSTLPDSRHGEGSRVCEGRGVETVGIDGLTADAINRVISGETLILRVRGFYSAQESALLRAAIGEKLEMRGYKKEKALQYGGGQAYFDLASSVEKCEQYFAHAPKWMATNATLAPVEWPLERFRRLLDIIWPRGARLLRDRTGRPAFAGLARQMKGGGPLYPHVDDLVEDDVHRCFEITKIIAQLSVLVYVAMPGNGTGGLHVWNRRPNLAERRALKDPDHAYRLRMKEPSDAHVTPDVGDLCLFNAQCVHSVDEPQGLRMTVSSFFLITPDNPGLLYS